MAPHTWRYSEVSQLQKHQNILILLWIMFSVSVFSHDSLSIEIWKSSQKLPLNSSFSGSIGRIKRIHEPHSAIPKLYPPEVLELFPKP
jgi:hypothetical protein